MARTLLNFLTVIACLLFLSQNTFAGDPPQKERHELMEGVGDGAKTIGHMVDGKAPFDAAAAMQAMQTWNEASEKLGDLFPPGSETGFKTRAKPNIWTDRAGFDSALQAWAEAVDTAIAANPQTLEELDATAGPVFKKCKACHEEYRAEKKKH